MEKRLVLSVTCINELTNDAPEVFSVGISEVLAAKIKHLASIVIVEQASTLHICNSQGTWSTVSPDESDLVNLLEFDQGAALAQIEDGVFRVQDSTLIVGDSWFRFSAVPKHRGSDKRLYTPRVPLNVLDGMAVTYVELED